MQKPDWTYGHSELLKQDFAFKQKHDGSLDVYTEDKTHYTQGELDVMEKGHCGEYDLSVHIIKQVFGGTIIE